MRRKRIISIIMTMCLLLFTGCADVPNPSEVIKEGSTEFGQGKIEEEYLLLSSEEVLERLIDEFSGSRSEATGGTLSDDQVQNIQDTTDDDDMLGGTDDDQSPGDGTSSNQKIEVSSKSELKKAVHKMFDETKTAMTFACENGYSPDIYDLEEIILELEREDPYDVICLDRYGIGGSASQKTISLAYHLDVDTLKEMKEETRPLVEKAVGEIDVQGLSDYEIVCTVNDYLCDTIEYPASEPYAAETHTAYSAFKKGSAVCDGYSRAAKLLLNEFGVECDFVVGVCHNGGGHAWNLVKLDGNWYQMDVTWNDTGAVYSKDARTDYLLVTDDFMKQSRSWDESLYPKTPKKAYR